MSTEPHTPRPRPSTSAAQALDPLIRERRPELVRIARSIAGAEEAEDAVQAACFGFLRNFDPEQGYDGAAGAYRFLAASTVNAALKVVRGRRRRQRGLPEAYRGPEDPDPVGRAPSADPDPLELLLRHEEDAGRWAELAGLPGEPRALLLLRAAGYRPAEIQSLTGLSSRQYRKRIEKANRHLAA